MKFDSFRLILNDQLRGKAALLRKYNWTPRNIRTLRLHMGLNQHELAKIVQVRQQTVSRWEHGHISPKRANKMALGHLAEYYGFTPLDPGGHPHEYQDIGTRAG